MKKIYIILISGLMMTGCCINAESKKDSIQIGNYEAKLIDADWGEDIQSAIDGKDTAGHNITGAGIEYIADHDTQGFAQCIWNDELIIHRANGKAETYHKTEYFEKSSNDGTWKYQDIDIYTYDGGDLLTQVCRGEGLYWAFWEKE